MRRAAFPCLALLALAGCNRGESSFDRSSAARSTEVSAIANTTGPNDGRTATAAPLTGDEAGQSMRVSATRAPQP